VTKRTALHRTSAADPWAVLSGPTPRPTPLAGPLPSPSRRISSRHGLVWGCHRLLDLINLPFQVRGWHVLFPSVHRSSRHVWTRRAAMARVSHALFLDAPRSTGAGEAVRGEGEGQCCAIERGWGAGRLRKRRACARAGGEARARGGGGAARKCSDSWRAGAGRDGGAAGPRCGGRAVCSACVGLYGHQLDDEGRAKKEGGRRAWGRARKGG
jgi:hypothetical protein